MANATRTAGGRGRLRAWMWLVAAMILELAATGMLHLTIGFTRPLPTIAVVLGYCLSFWCLTHTSRAIPLGLAYAIWTALGTLAVCVIGVTVLHQQLSGQAMVGIVLIVVGVCIVNLRGGGIVTEKPAEVAGAMGAECVASAEALDESPPR